LKYFALFFSNYPCVTLVTLIIIAQLMITVQSNLKQTEYENMSNEIWQYIILLRILSSFVYFYIFTSFILSI